MQIGMIGLGRMGANLSRRLIKHGHTVVVHDQSAETVATLAGDGAKPASSLADVVRQLTPPRAVWVMLPSGAVTEAAVAALGDLLSPGDVIIDGGNSNYKDDVRRAQELAAKDIRYIDVGTSGGVWGLERGYCLMIGGDRDSVQRLHRAGPSANRRPRRVTSTPARPGRATSSRWCTTASSTA